MSHSILINNKTYVNKEYNSPMETIGQKIRKHRRQKKMTQVELARKVGIDASAVSQWESDKTRPTTRSAYFIAKVLDIDISEITHGVNVEYDYKDTDKVKEKSGSYKPFYRDLPVVSYVQAGEPDVVLDLVDSDEAKKVRTYKKCSDKAYALEISGDSMTANSGRYSFPEGDYIAVDPEQRGDTTNGIFVVAKEVGRDAVNFKQLKYEGSTPYLNPLNDRFDKYFGEFIILGKVFDHIPKDMP